MDQKPSLDLVYLAVSTLYNNSPNCSEKERAGQWLHDLQKSVHAWTVADELLHHHRDLESCYFGAQTMRSKIHQSFHELPQNAHISLRDSLLNHISQITEETSSVIVTQLCLALADLALQMPSWKGAALDLINRLSQSNLWPLLEILTVLPEEYESRSVRLGENRRMEILEDLKVCSPTVHELLTHCCRTYGAGSLHDNIQIVTKVLRCFTSWTSLGTLPYSDPSNSLVIMKAFNILSFRPDSGDNKQVVGSLHDAATDCICTLLLNLENNNHKQEFELYLFNCIVNLEVPYHLSVGNEDQEKSMNYARLFTELGECCMIKLIDQCTNDITPHYLFKMLDLALTCVGHHDYEVAEITFNLWYSLSEELYQKNNKAVTDAFKPFVERLVYALCRHCQMEPDHEGLLDDGDDFKDFRLKVSDLVRDMVFIVGSSSLFKQMFLNLQTPGVTWDSSEAALFIMQAVAKSVLPSENEVVPKVVEAILSLQENTHIAVRHTSIMLLGELCEWIEQHPASLDPILNFLVCCLPQQGLAIAAAPAIQNICTSCSEHMTRHMPVLIQILEQVDTFSLPASAINGMLKGMSAIICCMQRGDVSRSMKEICAIQVKHMHNLIEKDIPPVRGTKTDPIIWLDRLATVFRYVVIHVAEGEENPCREVVLEVWPVVSGALDKYKASLRIMERACRCVRFMLRCVSQQIKEILESLVHQVIAIYQMHKHSCFLYLSSIMVDEYATDDVCVPGLLNMLQAVVEPTFMTLREENGLRNNPDTVDDFFRLCARFVQRAPLAFLRSTALPHIVQCALTACSLDHKEANTSVMKFLCDLVNSGKSGKMQPDFEERKQIVASILSEYGQQLVTNLVHASVFCLHTYMLSEVGDVLVELLDSDREMTNRWLIAALDSLPKETNGGLITVAPQQLTDIHIALVRSDTSKSVSHALKDLTRLYR